MEKSLKKATVISIIIATYNAEQYISECLASIFDLSGLSLEVLVIDGGSTDRTKEIVAAFDAPQLKWASESDHGIYDAMNKGVEKASGQWLYFMGADDRLLPGFVELASKLKNENTVYYGNSIPFYGNMPVSSYGLLTGEFSPYRLAKYCMNHQSILYPAKAFKHHRYELKYKIAADYAFNLRLWGDKRFKKQFYPLEVVIYNMTGFSVGNRDEVFYKDKSSLVRKGMGWIVYIRYLIREAKDLRRLKKE